MNEPVEPGRRDSGMLRISLRTAAIMLAFTLVFTALMAGTYTITAPLVAASALAEKLRLIGAVLPPGVYDNDLLGDYIRLPPQEALGLDEETRLWRARKDGTPVALVFEAAAPDGYAGQIRLLLAVNASGELVAVRVAGHHETPGLGDYIDPARDKDKAHPWITQFSHLGFADMPRDRWRVKKDGGGFEQRAGATISARAVTNATGRALAWAVAYRNDLFSLPTNGQFENRGSKP